MSNWDHKHIIDLSSFSFEDYKEVLQLANRFKKLPQTGSRKLPMLTSPGGGYLLYCSPSETRIADIILAVDTSDFALEIMAYKSDFLFLKIISSDADLK